LSWPGAPERARSFAVICVDTESPTKRDDANRKDRTVSYDHPRGDFVHWVLVDIPENLRELPEGADGEGLSPRGKPAEKTDYGVRGLNDYTSWFAGDADMEGNYAGYDGPWPPFNDERRHRYVFTVYALDVETLGLSGTFDLAAAKRAMQGHVLAEASLSVTYALYPHAR
jgi:Raf kinase inhibitor-like YbhB/YbcL family protein